MITGYNTDVRHLDAVFHVQTEDKGTENPFIESLVYVGGQVLAAKRASYADLLATGQGQRSVVELMERQHRTVIAAIKNGRFDAKLQALLEARKSQPLPAGTGAGRRWLRRGGRAGRRGRPHARPGHPRVPHQRGRPGPARAAPSTARRA